MVPLVLALAVSAPPEPQFAVSGAGARATGTLGALSLVAGARVKTADGEKAVPSVVSVRQVGAALPPPPAGAHVITAAGDRVPGRVSGGDTKALRFTHASSGEDGPLALDAVAAVWLRPPPADTPPDPARYVWLAGTPTRDVLLYRNGDTARGSLTAFTDTGVKFTPDGGAAREVPLADLTAIGFNPRFVRPRKPKEAFAHLVLADGARFAASEVNVKGDALLCKAVVGPPVTVRLTDLVALDVLQGPATYLADLKPKRAETVGFLGDGWPWAPDRTVRGQPLRLLAGGAENTFDRGLGTHPKTTLAYDLAGKFTRFEAVVGLDAVSGKRGRAAVRLLVDGKEVPLPDLKTLAAGDARAISVELKGAKELVLVIDFGPAGDVQADVNWGNARLLSE
ncbi:MAG: NPCBM/NEW2 domain-containing protein [Gemmata sp.]